MSRRLPLLTLAIAAAAVAVHAVPGAAEWLQYDRGALLRGEWWRVASSHLTHFDLNHLAWDAVVLLLLGWICERESRARTAAAVFSSAIAIPAALWWCQPEFAVYRGLSGIASAMFGLLAGLLLCRPRKIARLAGALALIAMIAKCACERSTHATLFASGENYVPVPLAHFVGLAAGLLSAARIPRWLASRAACQTAPSPCR